MKLGGGEIVVRALEDEGIPFTFGIPGTHNIELYDALSSSTRVRAILVTDEQSASFMADAVWRATGRMACANVVPGAGLTHALSGIAEASMDGVPLLVLGCGIRRDTGKAFQLHDIDQLALVKPVTKGTFLPRTGGEIYPAIREACRLARSGTPGPVMVEISANLYLFRHDVDLTPPAPRENEAAVPDELVEKAVALLAKSNRPLLYVGLGAAGAGRALVMLAERLEAPVSTTFQGKGVFPESHPLFLWPGFGDAAPPFARKIAAGCDATLAIGCRFGEVATGSYGLVPPRPLIHVDIEASVLGRNYQTDLGVTADAAAFVNALLLRLGERKAGPDVSMRAAIASGLEDVRREALEPSKGRVSPGRLLRALQDRFGPDTIFTSDSGNGTFLAVEQLKLDLPGKLLAPIDYSCMGYSVPAAVGAKLACPDTPVVALAGDGAFLMTGLELLTAAHEGVACLVVVLRDRELAQIAQLQSVALGSKTCSVLPDYDLLTLCRSVGVEGLPLERDDDIEAVLEKAAKVLKDGRPFVLDVAIDYSKKTHFTRGIVKTNLARLPWPDRLRFVGRALMRRVVPPKRG